MSRAKLTALASVIMGLVGLLLAAAYDLNRNEAAIGVVLITMGFCGYFGLARFYASGRDVYPDFLSVFLVFQFINKSLTLLSLLLGAPGNEAFPNVGVTEFRARAEWVFLASTVLFWIGWRVVIPRSRIFRLPYLTKRQISTIYVLSLTAYALTGVLFDMSSLGTLVSLFRAFALGVISIMLYGEGEYGLGRRRSIVPILMLVPFLYLSLRSGSKGELVIVAMPIVLAALKRMSLMRLGILAGFAALMFVFVVPLTVEIRNANWIQGEQIGFAEAAARVDARWQDQGVLRVARDGALEFLQRASSADSGALVMAISQQDGHIGSQPLQDGLSIFIPRMFWPEKPLYAPGAWFTWYLGFADSPETATTATAMMLGTELFWMYGVFGVIIGMLALGAIHAITWKALIAQSDRSAISMASVLAFLTMAIRFEETAAIYAFSAPLIFLAYMKVFAFAERMFSTRPRTALR
jgi:hypothetical protein